MIRKIPGTIALASINIIVFVWMAILNETLMFNEQEDFLSLLWTGANFNPFTLGGEPWRLITSMFLHGNIYHIALNLFGLFSLATLLEPAIGTVRFLIIYFVAGITAGLFSLIFNVYTPSLGASGAIFGLYGFLIAIEVLTNFRDKAALVSILLNFVFYLALSYFLLRGIADTAGHAGGLLAGIALGILHYTAVLRSTVHYFIVLAVLPFFMALLPKDQLQYYQLFQRVLNAEDRVQRVYAASLADAQFADSLRTSRAEWSGLREELKVQSVPSALMADTLALKQYLILREEEVTYRLTMVEKESYVYLDSLDITMAKFDSLPRMKYVLNYRLPEVREQEPEELSSPQEKNPLTTVFYDSVWKETDSKEHARFYRIGHRDSLGRWQGAVRDYFISGKIQMKGKYLDGMNHGVFLYYRENNTYESAGRYEKDQSIGKWEHYHANGKLASEIHYSDRAYTQNVWDTAGVQQVVNGYGRQITRYPNGVIAEEGEYVNGLKEGYWQGFHENGRPYFKELYKGNRLVRGVSVTNEGKQYEYDHSSFFPFPKMGMTLYKKYLEDNLRKPLPDTIAAGVVKLSFLVDTDGSVRDFVVLESLCISCDQEAIRLVKEGPPWRPGLLHGHKEIQSGGYVEVNWD